MRSDKMALLKIFAWSFALTILALGVGAAALFGGLSREVAACIMLGILVVGVMVIRRKFTPALFHIDPPKDTAAKDGDI